jgi:hypothetical protein
MEGAPMLIKSAAAKNPAKKSLHLLIVDRSPLFFREISFSLSFILPQSLLCFNRLLRNWEGCNPYRRIRLSRRPQPNPPLGRLRPASLTNGLTASSARHYDRINKLKKLICRRKFLCLL